jgi:hypothetical protein
LNELAAASRRIADLYRDLSKQGAAIYVPGLKGVKAPHLSRDESAAFHEHEAIYLTALARHCRPIRTKRQDGKNWPLLQFIRGMSEAMLDMRSDLDASEKVDDLEAELVAAVTNLVFKTASVTSRDVIIAHNKDTTRTGRLRKTGALAR